MKKVRVTISDFMNEIIKSDSEYFRLPIGKIGNIIFNYYIDKNLTHDVGTKKPNQLGLYDCSGNVLEWCYDTDSSGYISEEFFYIYDASIEKRILRGGSWNYTAGSLIIFDRASIISLII